MKLTNFLKARQPEIALLLDEKRIKKLLAFKNISFKCKNGEIKGLLVSDNLFGFTDSHRAFGIEGTVQLPLSRNVRYAEEVLLLLEKASSIAIMTNAELAVCIKEEVHLFQPVGICPNITEIFENSKKYNTFQYACSHFYGMSKEVVWKCMLQAFDEKKRGVMFHFSPLGMRVKMQINEDSQLKETWEIDYKGTDIVMHLNPSYLDVWFKNVKERMCEVRIKSKFLMIAFQQDGMNYCVMPMAVKEGGN